MLLLLLTAPGLAVDLPATGQTICYETVDPGAGLTGAAIPCAGTGQDGEHRAGVAWPEPRFEITWCDAAGPCAQQTGDCDGNEDNDVIVDHLTGLTWVRTLDVPDDTVDWPTALQSVAALDHCGSTDWRAPNVTEARSLANWEVEDSEVWLRGVGFTHLRTTWTSTTTVDDPERAFTVAAAYGYTHRDTKGSRNSVWAVRGSGPDCTQLLSTGQDTCYDSDGMPIGCAGTGQDGDHQAGAAWPSPRFQDNGDGTVTDLATELTWLQDANCLATSYAPTYPLGRTDWQGALDAVAAINAGSLSACAAGQADWRLPNPVELTSLISYQQVVPALPAGHPFANPPVTPTFNYWTSTSWGYPIDMPDRIEAWYVHLYDGALYDSDKRYDEAMVWPVRGGVLDGGDCTTPPDTGDTGLPTPPTETADTGLPGDVPDIDAFPSPLRMGAVLLGESGAKVSRVSNLGTADLHIGNIIAGLDLPNVLRVSSDGCSDQTLAPQDSCDIEVTFTPHSLGNYYEVIPIPSDDPDEPVYELGVVAAGDDGDDTTCSCQTGAPLGGWLLLPLAAGLMRRRR